MLSDADFTRKRLIFNPDGGWSNATFASTLCARDELSGSDISVTITAASNGARFILPDCIVNLETTLAELNGSNLVLVSSPTSGQRSDPLSRLPANLASLALFNSALVTSGSNAPITSLTWSNVFNSHPSLTQFIVARSGLQATLPSTTPALIQVFDLSGNRLTGTIPPQFLSNLTQDLDYDINLANNKLSGAVPNALLRNIPLTTDADSLRLDVSFNTLTGVIPSDLFSNSVFISEPVSIDLNLASNQMTGSIPARLYVGSTDRFTSVSFNVSANKITGTLPTSFISLNSTGVGTVLFDASANQLAGAVPLNLIGLRDYTHIENLIINLSKNKLTKLPRALNYDYANGTEIDSLVWNLASNSIAGTLPATLFGTATVHQWILSLQSNLITGALPNTFFNESLESKDISISFASNKLSGSIPADFFEGMISRVGALAIDFSSNSFTGSIADGFMRPLTFDVPQPDRYIDLNFARNKLSGSLPSEMVGPSVWSVKLNFDYNTLSGSYPYEDLFFNASSYYIALLNLSAAGNQLSGTINLPKVPTVFPLFLNLSSNKLNDLVVDQSAIYPYALDFSNNPSLQGILPPIFFSNASFLVVLKAAKTALSGPFPNIDDRVLTSRLLQLDLSSTSIDFCPEDLASWTAPSLQLCSLRSTSAASCTNIYPTQCTITRFTPTNPPSLAAPTPFASVFLLISAVIAVLLAAL